MKLVAVLLFAPMLMLSVVLLPVIGLATLVSTAGTSVAATASMAPVLDFLVAQIGKPYSATVPDGPDSWDCSGLVTGAYRTVGINLPSLTFDQVKLGDPVPIDPIQVHPGDALFMRGGNPVTDLGHVAVAINAQQMISAPAPGSNVHISPIPWQGIQQVRRYITTTPADSSSWQDFLTAHYETSGVTDPTATLTGVQVAALFYWSGCRDELVSMVAIAGRESHWNPTAYNLHSDTTGDISLGLVQENVKGDMANRLTPLGLTDPRQLFNPVNAARAAVALSDGCTNLRPWGGYKGMSNTYGTDMLGATVAVAAARAQGLIP